VTKLTLLHGLSIAVTLALLLLVFELVRRKRLAERYAILWLLAAATLFVLATWRGLLTSLSHDVGISYPPSALFAVAIGLIAMILLNFSLVVSRLSDQNKILAQRLSLLQHRLEEREGGAPPSKAMPALDTDGQPPTDRFGTLDGTEERPARAGAEELSRSR
jgi:hypothetical protein